jgi:Clr5 domain
MEDNLISADHHRSGDIHAAEEWEQIRNIVTQLYRDKNKKLSEIRETLARQGFDAT